MKGEKFEIQLLPEDSTQSRETFVTYMQTVLSASHQYNSIVPIKKNKANGF